MRIVNRRTKGELPPVKLPQKTRHMLMPDKEHEDEGSWIVKCQAALLVAATKAPDGGLVTLHPRGNRVDQFAGGDGQDDADMLDLEPGQVPALSDGLEDRKIIGSDGQGTRLSAAHGTTSDAGAGSVLQHTSRPQFVALLRDYSKVTGRIE